MYRPHPDHRGPRRMSLALSAAVMVVALTNPRREASAQNAVKACTTLAEDGQRLRAAGKLIEARDKLIACSTAECPQVVRADCAQWASEVLASTPTIVIDVRDSQGTDTADARVFVDGKLVANRIDGRPISIDPGERTVRVERSDGMFGVQRIVAKENAKGREVRFVLSGTTSSPPSADEPSSSSPRVETSSGSWGPLHYAGIAMIAVGAIGITYALVKFTSYKSDEADLRAKFDDAEQAAKGCPSDAADTDPTSTCGKNVRTREDLRAAYNKNEADGNSEKGLVFTGAIGGTLLVAGGIVMLALAPTTKSSPPVRGGPVVTPTFAGLTLGGTF